MAVKEPAFGRFDEERKSKMNVDMVHGGKVLVGGKEYGLGASHAAMRLSWPVEFTFHRGAVSPPGRVSAAKLRHDGEQCLDGGQAGGLVHGVVPRRWNLDRGAIDKSLPGVNDPAELGGTE